MIIDCHAHYDDSRFDADRKDLLMSMEGLGIKAIVNSTADYKSFKESFALAEDYPFIYTTLGIHPSEVGEIPPNLLDEMRGLSNHVKCVAIGEIGLDYYWEKEEAGRALQREWFVKQLLLAKELKMPVVIHSRDACEDTLSILKENAGDGLVCDIHCFSYSPEIALEYVKMGFYIGVGGVLTFSNSKKLKETVEQIPLSQILLETDCPYLAPHPFRGERNDSTFIPYVVREIAKLKGLSEEEVIEVTCKNAEKFFGIKA